VSGEVFNVGCGDRISVTDLWQAIQGVLGIELEARYGPARAGDVRDSLADLTKISDRLGYRVKVSLQEGIRFTAEWLRSQRDSVTAGAGRAASPGAGQAEV
jgi:UDP-N-acetylglucosamine 4-epimerase